MATKQSKHVPVKAESSISSDSSDSEAHALVKQATPAKMVSRVKKAAPARNVSLVKEVAAMKGDSSLDLSKCKAEEESPESKKPKATDLVDQPTKEPKSGDGGAVAASSASCHIFIADIPWAFIEDELKAVFADVGGEITSVLYPRGANGGCNGTAFMSFDNAAAAEAAIALDGQAFGRGRLKIRLADSGEFSTSGVSGFGRSRRGFGGS